MKSANGQAQTQNKIQADFLQNKIQIDFVLPENNPRLEWTASGASGGCVRLYVCVCVCCVCVIFRRGREQGVS